MNGEEFKKPYLMTDGDESITAFTSEVGFSLIRKYPENTVYYKDGRRMFIKIAVLDRGFFYSVDMTKPLKRDEATEYIITDGEEYKKKVTNFMSDGSEFTFDKVAKIIVHQPTSRNFTINEFVEILVKNHLSDKLVWKRKANAVANSVLKFIFWLSDKHYDRVKTMPGKFGFNQKETSSEENINNVEPFFKYFSISRNTLFVGLVAAFLVAILFRKCKIVSEFTVANPLIVLAFFLLLFLCEKISFWLNAKIKEFFTPRKFYNEEPNFIEQLHDYQYRNSFKLSLN